MNKLKQARKQISHCSTDGKKNNLKHITVYFDSDYGAVVTGKEIPELAWTFYKNMTRKEKASVLKSLLMQAIDKAFNVYPKKGEVKGGPMLIYKEGEFNPEEVDTTKEE